jgi:hypothetical protein
MSSSRHSDTLDLDEDDDEDDDNEYAIYHYNHRYGGSSGGHHNHHQDQYDNNHQGLGDEDEEDHTGFADFENTPTFDAAFADFSTLHDDQIHSNASGDIGASFQANFDEATFATFPDSNFSDQDWGTQPASSSLATENTVTGLELRPLRHSPSSSSLSLLTKEMMIPLIPLAQLGRHRSRPEAADHREEEM